MTVICRKPFADRTTPTSGSTGRSGAAI